MRALPKVWEVKQAAARLNFARPNAEETLNIPKRDINLVTGRLHSTINTYRIESVVNDRKRGRYREPMTWRLNNVENNESKDS